MKTVIEGTPVIFAHVNSLTFIEKMVETQSKTFEKFVEPKGYIHKD